MGEENDIRQVAGLKDDKKSSKPVYPSPARLLFLVVASIFSVEITYMLFLHKLVALPPFQEALLDAFTLVLLVTPALYYFIYRPFVIHIEEHRKAEEAVKESEARFRQIFQQVTDYILVLEPANDGPPIIVDASDAGFEKHGYTRKELLGKPITFLDADESKIPGRMGALEADKELRFEAIHRRKDGSTFIVDVSTKMITTGNKTLVFSVERDITARKQAEKALRESEEQFRSIFDYSKVGVNVLGSDYKYIKVNRAFCDMIGYSEKELLMHDFKGITHPEDIETNMQLANKLRAGEIDFYHLEKRYIHKNGGTVWGDLTVSSVRAEDRTLRYVVAIIQDMTERKETEQALLEAKEKAEEATRLKDKFVSLVSHDLKTPLTSMIGFLKLVRHDNASPLNEGAKLILDRGIDSGKQMVSLIDDLLTISRFKTGQLKLNKQFFDAKYLGVKMIADYSPLARQKGIEMENTIPDNSRIYGDKTLLSEAIQNLVTNAIKFCKSGDRIIISLADKDPSTICIGDTGPGIKPELLKNIFDYDKKTSTLGTAGEIGTGFGLPLVKDIIELHGGELEVNCTGKGCLFRLKLPHVGPRILLVDDDRNFRYMQILHLKEMNASVIEAENGEEALNMIAAMRPHLIITDIKMPVMDGLELLRNVKGRPDMKDIPVIMVSGEFGMEIRDTVFKLGADDFVTKKIDPVDFLPRVRRFIG